MQIKKVITNVSYPNGLEKRVVEAFAPAQVKRLESDDLDGIRLGLKVADVAVLQTLLPSEDLQGPNLRWLHLNHAGLDRIARPEMFERKIRVSGSAGYSAETLAEHALFFMLSLAYRSRNLLDSQRRSAWEKKGRKHLRSLYGASVGIIGLGHIGQALAVRCSALGMRVIGYQRKTERVVGVDQHYSANDHGGLDKLIAASDYVVLALPLTNTSRNIINARTLNLMKPNACLINIARGGLVDEAALIKTLKADRIAGAGLDVFCQEPLPSTSPLWTLPNVLITPHTSPQEPNREQRAVDLLIENIHRYKTGKVLINEMSQDDIYVP